MLAAIILGLYLFQLWKPERQLQLHSAHLIAALEENDRSAILDFLDPSYGDQWGHDRATLVARLQAVLPYAPHLRIEARRIIVRDSAGAGEWSARIRVEADANEVTALIKERINPLEEPFLLQWRRVSWKPWDWKLVRVTNEALQLPTNGF